MSLNVSSVQPLLGGLMAASGVLGEQLRRARGHWGLDFENSMTLDEIQLNPCFLSFKKTVSLLNECPLKMCLQ